MKIIGDFWFYLKNLYPLWKDIRSQRKYSRSVEKRKNEEGLVSAFLYEFEQNIMEEMPHELVKLILTEFCVNYFQLTEESKSDKDIQLESTLIQYMDKYEITLVRYNTA